jgi:GT2 family glycosyltransferase
MTDPSESSQRRATVGAVVLTWRDRIQTVQCVAQLLRHTAVTRVLVVDNEADGTIGEHFALDSRLTFRELTSNTGFAVGVNTGLEELMRDPAIDLFLVINNDATLAPADLDRLIDALATDASLGMVGPMIVTPDGRSFSAGGVVNRLTWGIRQPRQHEQPDFLTWACVLLRPQTIEAVGLLDERFFMYWEDVDFGLRMTERGARFAEVSSAVLLHEVSSSHVRAGSRISAYSSQAFRHFLRVHGGRLAFLGHIRMLTKIGMSAISGDMVGARYMLAGWRLGRRSPNPAYTGFERMP